MANLLKDDYPVLMEGIHCTWPFMDSRFAARKKFIRLHNVEYRYYQSLAKHTGNFFKKLFFYNESRLLRQYEKKVAARADGLWAVSQEDAGLYRDEFGASAAHFLPLFIPPWQVSSGEGMGSYCLYHGDLSINVNERMVMWLLRSVFNRLNLPLVIAGKNPSASLTRLAEKQTSTCLIANPGEADMADIISKAHINIIPSYSSTGIKIKLLNALYNGRHCLVNSATAAGSGMQQLCHIADTAEAMRQRIEQLYHQPFTLQEKEVRTAVLQQHFCNNTGAKRIVEWIWG